MRVQADDEDRDENGTARRALLSAPAQHSSRPSFVADWWLDDAGDADELYRSDFQKMIVSAWL